MNLDNPASALTQPEIQRAAELLVRRIAREMNLPDGAVDDLQQAVSIKLLALTKERLEVIENINAYLATVVRNEANRMLASAARHPELPLDETEYSDNFQFQRRIESWIILKEIWQKLSSEEHKLFRLMLFDYNEREMALRLNISHDAARKRVSRLRQKLDELIQSHSYPSGSS